MSGYALGATGVAICAAVHHAHHTYQIVPSVGDALNKWSGPTGIDTNVTL
jgi:hypothetical protein